MLFIAKVNWKLLIYMRVFISVILFGGWIKLLNQSKLLLINVTFPEEYTVKILKFGTPKTIIIIVLKVEKFDVALH